MFGRVMKNVIKERRVKIVFFDSPDTSNFFIVESDDTYPLRIKDNDLPDDHVVLSISFGIDGNKIACLVASETFDSVEDDAEIEMLLGTDKYKINFLEMGGYKLRI